MKYLLFSLLLFLAAPGFAQKANTLDAISNYFSEYVDDSEFTAIYISGKVFELFREADLEIDEIDDEEVAAILEMVRDIQGVRVLITENNSLERYREAKSRIPTDHYELLFKVRTTDGENVECFVQNEGAIMTELFMLIGAEDTFALLSFVGDVDLSKLAKLQSAFD